MKFRIHEAGISGITGGIHEMSLVGIYCPSKYFIYRCKLNKGSLCMRLLVDKFKKTFQTERFIAKKKTTKSTCMIKNGNLYFH